MKNLEIKNADCHAALAMTKKAQSGRSMIEMLGVLAIIGVLSVGGIAGYSKAMHKYRINKTIEQITLIAGNVRAFFAPQRNYIGVDCYGNHCISDCRGHSGVDSDGSPTYSFNGCPITKKAKILPDEMITITADKITAITNPFGYATGLQLDNKSIANDHKAFYIYYLIGDNIEACIELMTQDWSAANVNAIKLNNGSSAMYFKTPVSIDLATEKCATSISNTTAENKAEGRPSLAFYFDIDLGGSYWNPKAGGTGTWQN